MTNGTSRFIGWIKGMKARFFKTIEMRLRFHIVFGLHIRKKIYEEI